MRGLTIPSSFWGDPRILAVMAAPKGLEAVTVYLYLYSLAQSARKQGKVIFTFNGGFSLSIAATTLHLTPSDTEYIVGLLVSTELIDQDPPGSNNIVVASLTRQFRSRLYALEYRQRRREEIASAQNQQVVSSASDDVKRKSIKLLENQASNLPATVSTSSARRHTLPICSVDSISIQAQEIFGYWNSKGIVRHVDYEKQKPAIRRAIKSYTADVIRTAIDNYAKVLKGDDYFWTHKWELRHFLQRGMDKFVTYNFNEKDYLHREDKNGISRGASAPSFGRNGAYGRGRIEDPLDPAVERSIADMHSRWGTENPQGGT